MKPDALCWPLMVVSLCCHGALLAPTGAGAAQPLATTFDDGLAGWKLQLNHGAQASTAVDDSALRFDIERLAAPGDKAFAANVQLRYEPVTLEPNTHYVFRVSARSTTRRGFSLGVSDVAAARTIGDASWPFWAGRGWDTYWGTFQSPDAEVVARLQIIVGASRAPLWVDDVRFAETKPPLPLRPADLLWGDHMFLPRLEWEQKAGASRTEAKLPESFSLSVSPAANLAAPPLIKLKREGALPLALEIGPDATHLRELGGDVLLELPGLDGAPQLTLQRSYDTLRLEQFGEVLGEAVAPGRVTTMVVAVSDPEQITLTAHELLPPERVPHANEAVTIEDPETGVIIHRLTHSPRHDKHAYYDITPWSRDGSLIVFASALPGEKTSKIMLMNADGSDIREFADDGIFSMNTGAFTQWAPDGKSVYYTARTAAGPRLARVDLAAGEQAILGSPSRMISPDGKHSLWLESGERGGLGIMDADGSNAKIIVKWEDAMALSPSQGQIASNPPRLINCKWAPDGKRILFGISNEFSRPRTVKELYTVDPDGSDLKRLCKYRNHHSWSPDGKQVMFNGQSGLMLISADGKNLRKISDTSIGHPSFSPDGELVVTESAGGAFGPSLVMINPKTGEARKLVNVPSARGYIPGTRTYNNPVWSPDGKQILYDSDQSGTSQLYVVDVPAWGDLPKSE